ncbi:MAG: 2-oxo acid dehydrogenase subunit E2 [Burkholderiales bacterium]|nr:2-oxo acid dehydrogenase subunit E2 [Anaerolineae bacterium]
MQVEIKMPDLATTDDEVTLVRWLIDVGQPVRLGQPLLEIETDKATMDVESIAAGTLSVIHVQSGERVAVGQIIAIVENVGATGQLSAPKEVVTAPTRDVGATHVLPLQSSVIVPAPTIAPNKTSFFARNKAARQGQTVQADSIALTATQREIARRLQDSKQNVPHFYLTTSANAEHMAAMRAASEPRLVWDAFFVQAAARALRSFERMRYRFDGDKLTLNPNSIGVAADVDDVLYIVPVDNPLSLTLEQISEQIRSRVDAIRQGDPSARKLSAASLTITNLGAENIESFQAIINPPEVAILAIGKIAPVVWAQDGQVVIQRRVSLSLSADHRVVNGKYAAKFLSKVVQEIESI